MERFQGHINPFFLNRKSDTRSLEVQGFEEAIKEEKEEDSVPLLKMLQSEEEEDETSMFLSAKEPNFLALLSLQNLKEPWELESYLSQEDHLHFHSPVQSQTNRFHPISIPFNRGNEMTPFPSSSSSPHVAKPRKKPRKIGSLLPQEMTKEKRKRRRTKPTKNIEEIEHQRMNHIAVERNRRRQMNEHINSLRTLLPPSYIQRVDQASIVGGAINYVKFLEQIIQSLELEKRMQEENASNSQETSSALLSGISSNTLCTEDPVPRIETTVIQNYVSLKVECPKRQGQLLKGIISLEKLRLTVLHLNIASSSHCSVSYSFNLKMEDDCDLESADEITKAAHKIFDIRLTNNS